jgi:hypothetical protein
VSVSVLNPSPSTPSEIKTYFAEPSQSALSEQIRHRLTREANNAFACENAVRIDADNKQAGSFLRFEERTKSFDFAFEARAADFEIVPLGLDVLDLRLEGAHLVDAFLSVAASGHGIGFSLFDLGDHGGDGAVFGAPG